MKTDVIGANNSVRPFRMPDTGSSVSQFSEYVGGVIVGRDCLTWARSSGHRRTDGGISFAKTSLEAAFNEYEWKNKTFEANSTDLSNYRTLLRQSLEQCNADALQRAIESILRWGGVWNGNRTWLDGIWRNGLLLENIKGALRELQSTSFEGVRGHRDRPHW